MYPLIHFAGYLSFAYSVVAENYNELLPGSFTYAAIVTIYICCDSNNNQRSGRGQAFSAKHNKRQQHSCLSAPKPKSLRLVVGLREGQPHCNAL